MTARRRRRTMSAMSLPLRGPVLVLAPILLVAACREAKPLRSELDDQVDPRWLDGDVARARAEAQASGRPICAVFRCVP